MRWMTTITAALAVTAFGLAIAVAQEQPAEPESSPEATDEQPLRKESPAPEAEREATIRALVAELGSEEFDRREAAYRELARLGEAARPALEAARKSEDLQVRVSAERLLRRLGRAQSAEEPRRELSPDRSRERWLEEWMRELEERGFQGMDRDAWRRQMDRRLEDMRKELEGLERELQRDVGQGLGGGVERHVVVRTDEESIDCRVDAAGAVTVVVTRHGDGAGQATTYEAPGVEEFRKRHPEVWAKVQGFLGGPTLRLRIGRMPDDWPFRGLRRPPTPAPVPGEGRRLGVHVGEISAALRSHLGLAPEEGLLVEEVVPGTIAERLGLERYDVILRVAGMSVADAADVREALEKHPEEALLKVLVVRRGKRLELVEKR